MRPRHSQYISSHASIGDGPGEEPAIQSNGDIATIETGVNVIGVGQLANMGSMASVNQQMKQGRVQSRPQSGKKNTALN